MDNYLYIQTVANSSANSDTQQAIVQQSMLTTNKRKFPKGIKGVKAERSYLFLEIVLINKESIIDVCTNKILVEKNNAFVNHLLLNIGYIFFCFINICNIKMNLLLNFLRMVINSCWLPFQII